MEYPGVGTGVIIENDKKEVLMGLRIKDNVWGFPGGKVDLHESIIECAKRETQEECGINITDVSFVSAINNIMPPKHFLTIAFKATQWSGEVENKEPHSFVEWKWFAWDSLPINIFTPTQRLIEAYLHKQIFIDDK